jgi:hypothetical protein
VKAGNGILQQRHRNFKVHRMELFAKEPVYAIQPYRKLILSDNRLYAGE